MSTAASSPWQRLYAAAHRRRVRWWATRAERLPALVWSVGNLHWGGTGKTPLVAAIAAWLRDRGRRVAILSRGYGRQGRAPLVVSRGWAAAPGSAVAASAEAYPGGSSITGPLVGPRLAGDEPWLLAEQLPGVAVVVAARRVDAGRLAMAQLAPAPDLFLLDDGFSHLPLVRDLDLLALPASDPLGGGRLWPGGRLREPLTAAARAHAALLTGAGADAAMADAVGGEIVGSGFTGPVFAAPASTGAPRRVSLETSPPADNPGSSAATELPAGPWLLLTGIASPARVRAAAAAQGLPIADHLALPDHAEYPPATLRRIAERARAVGARAVLTTAKDRVKLATVLPSPLLPLPVLELPLVATPEPAFWDWLAARLVDR